MRVIVCGGRTYGRVPKFCEPEHLEAARRQADEERAHFFKVMDKYRATITALAAGEATGADALAFEWADRKMRTFPVQEFRADWKALKKAAGPIRNQQMLDEFKPDAVIAFPGGTGTADMMRRAKAAGVRVIIATPQAHDGGDG